jgi:methionyl-tRNA formyltransferase
MDSNKEVSVLSDPLRVVFMGTSDFAVPSLLTLEGPLFSVAGVVTQPDRPAGRGLNLHPSPVKVAALQKGWDVFQPEKMRDPIAVERLQSLSPDLIIVAAYGQILPKSVLQTPRVACLNVHASLLPRWRGAAPIHYAVMAGDTQTGVTIMYMNEKMDEGDRLLEKTVPIRLEDTTGVLHDRLALVGAEALQEALGLLVQGQAPRVPQDSTLATYAPSLKREHCKVRWNQTARKIADHIRGLDPWPSAECSLGGVSLKLFDASVVEGQGSPGSILALGPDGAVVATGDGAVRFKSIQPPGKRRMGSQEFSLGHSAFKIGAVLS